MDLLTGWDWFVVLVALVSVAIGLLRGLIRTVFALAAWVAGLLFAPLAARFVLPHVGDVVPAWVMVAICFLVLFAAVRLAGGLIGRGVRSIGLGGADRALGGALGLLRALAIVALVAVGAHLAGFSRQPAWQQALSRPLLDRLVDWVEPWLPQRARAVRRS